MQVRTHIWNKKSAAIIMFSAVALAGVGCTSTGHMAQTPSQMNNASKGALAGAAAGAVIQSSGNRSDIAKGAAIGAILGGGAGYVLDETQK